MTSIFSILYIAIQQRIKDQVPEIEFIDSEYGQLENHSGEYLPPVDWPCVLIDIDNAIFKEIGANMQVGEATVIIRVGFPPYESSSSITPAQYRNQGLYHFDLEDKLHRALHGWHPGIVQITDTEQVDTSNVFGALIRKSARTEERYDLIRVRSLTYSIGIDDASTAPEITIVEGVKPNINVHL